MLIEMIAALVEVELEVERRSWTGDNAAGLTDYPFGRSYDDYSPNQVIEDPRKT